MASSLYCMAINGGTFFAASLIQDLFPKADIPTRENDILHPIE